MAFDESGEQIAREAFGMVGLEPSTSPYGVLCVQVHDRMIGIAQDGERLTVIATDVQNLATATAQVTGGLVNSGTLAMLLDHVATNELGVI